ncbi:MAG: ankyrin repeat domain-containing protein [Verrucomicrobiota bacterium]
MKPAGFLFRTLLLAAFTLSLLAGAILTDYYLRHEITGKATRYLVSRGIELSTASAISAAEKGELILLEKLEHAGIDLGHSDERGFTPLLAAVRSGNLSTIHYLMKRDSVVENINQPTNPDRQTPLSAALVERDFDLARELLKAGADINADKDAGIPFLIEAVRSNDSEMLGFLFEKGVDVEYRGTQPVCALGVAAGMDSLPLMRRLIEREANVDVRGVSGNPLLIEAVQEANWEKFRLLIDSGANVDCKTGESTGMEMTPLSFAVASNNLKMQEALLAKGADCNVTGTGGAPLIFETVQSGDLIATRRLLENGANPDVFSGSGVTPLLQSVVDEDLDMVDLLLSENADPSLAEDQDGSPLAAAVDTSNIAIANLLIVSGAELDTRGLLATAYEKRDDPLMNLLLNAGADPESTFPGTKERVFDVAVHDGATAAVRSLLASGATIGNNLWAALLTGQDDLIRLILDAGADPRQLGPEGEDPLDFCLKKGKYKAARMLLAGGANPNAR